MNYLKRNIITLFAICAFTLTFQAQIHDKSWKKITNMEESSWFASQEAKDIAENVMIYQRNIGGWEKNIQMQKTNYICSHQFQIASSLNHPYQFHFF